MEGKNYENNSREAGKGWKEKVWQIDITPRGDSFKDGEPVIKEIFDSGKKLEPLRCLIHRESNGDLRFDFSSEDNKDKDQTFELIINDKTHALVTFRPSPEGGLFVQALVSRDELAELVQNLSMSKLIFRLRRCE